MTEERALVLCHTEAGLRAAAWLARRGVAVRLLCTGPFPVSMGAPVALAGPEEPLTTWFGPLAEVTPSLALQVGGRALAVPRRKRDLLQAVDGSRGALVRYLVGRALRPADTAMEWTSRWLGTAAWDHALGPWLTKRMGGPAARAPAGAAWRLFGRGDGDGWWAPARDGTQRAFAWVDEVIEAGGEALEEVAVEGLEVDEGRVLAVLTEFGREHIPGRLVTDLSPGQLARWLPEEAGLDRAELMSWPVADRVDVRLPVAVSDARPWSQWVCDDRKPLVTVRRAWEAPGVPSRDEVVAELVLGAGDTFADRSEAALGQLAATLLDGIAEVTGPPRAVVRHRGVVPRPIPRSEAQWPEVARRYQSLGILPVGEGGLGLPMALRDEWSHLDAAYDGAVVATLRDRLLTHGAPEEPWVLMGEA